MEIVISIFFKTDKRLIRATLKTYESTGAYVFLTLFKKAKDDYEFEQRISLTLGEFENLVSSNSKLQNSVADQKSAAKPPLAKKPKIHKELVNWLKRCLSVLQITELPSFSIGNFNAVCAHFDENSHYQFLIHTTTFENETLKRYQSFPVPCVYTAFKFLFWTAPNLETNGDVFS